MLGSNSGTTNAQPADSGCADRLDAYRHQFLAALPAIRAQVAKVCRQRGLSHDQAHDLAAAVYVKFIENDYGALRQLRDKGQLATFAFSLAYRCLLDLRNRDWGKWRPSRAARDLGSAAIFLEQLIVRDRVPADQAFNTLAHAPRWRLSNQQVRALYHRLPNRPPHRRMIELETAPPLRILANPETIAAAEERARARAETRVHVSAAIRTLSRHDRRLLHLRFHHGRPICEIADATGHQPKALYRYFARLLRRIRKDLESKGVTRSQILPLFQHDDQ